MKVKRHRCQCLPYAFLNTLNGLGAEITEDELFTALTHDGTDIVFPDYNVPLCYRGFHITELVYFCYTKGYSVTEFPAELALTSPNGNDHEITLPYSLHDIMKHSNGVVITARHALSWIDHKIIDPDTGDISNIKSPIRCYYAVNDFDFVRPYTI